MTKSSETLLLATTNLGKVRELTDLLIRVPIDVIGLSDFKNVGEVEENGSTFRENAELKAGEFARRTGRFCLADDSGLEVNVLGGAPGVRSARFAGADASYDVKIGKLLGLIAATGKLDRSARFVCSMALAQPSGNILYVAEGVCAGSIAEGPRGSNGFGYDPIFIPEGYDQTFGQLGDDVKRRISHRARATREIIRYLLDFIEV